MINPVDATGVYGIEYTDKNSDKGCYISITKRKTNGKIKELQDDIKNGKNNTAIARLALNENIKVNFNNHKALKL